MALDISQVSWYAEIVNLIVSGSYLPSPATQQKKKLKHEAKFYIWDDLFLFKKGVNKVMRKCFSQTEACKMLESFHSTLYRGHY